MKLIITEPKDFSAKAFDALSDDFDVLKLQDISKLKDHIDTAEVLFIRLGIVFSKEILKKAKKLKIICSPTTGLDHLDLDFCNKKRIKVISLKGERQFLDSIPSTAEHSWTLLMAINRKLYQANESVKAGLWDRDSFKSYNLKGKTLGVLGLGRVGKHMAGYAKAFGMHVIGYDIDQHIKIEGVKNIPSTEELFRQSDFISLHIPLNESNFEFVNQNLIDLMKPNACLINTSRGKIWEEKAIAKAIVQNKIRGVATDVVYDELSEHWQNSPLLKIDPDKYNCIITPHIAGATYDSMHATEEFIVQKLLTHVG